MKLYFKPEMKDFTTFRVGGVCDVLAEPKDISELVKLIKYLKKNYIHYYIMGNGSNILVSDKGIRGCVIHIGSNLSKIKLNDTKIEAEPGVLMSEIASFALKNKLTGFEELSGIPGSVGGAVTMNAGAYGKSMKDLVVSVNAINDAGNSVKLSKDALEFDYRKSSIEEKGFVITNVILNLQQGNKNDIEKKMENYKILRNSKQPLEFPSAGSFFKSGNGYVASKLIQESNLKGETVGDAEVSIKHSGFIINKGNATATDIYKLMKKVQSVVKLYYNVDLEPEVKLWGKF